MYLPAFYDAYSNKNSSKYNLVHVDSSMVSLASTRLVKGIDHKNRKKSVEYSVNFDGLLPCHFNVLNLSTRQKFN